MASYQGEASIVIHLICYAKSKQDFGLQNCNLYNYKRKICFLQGQKYRYFCFKDSTSAAKNSNKRDSLTVHLETKQRNYPVELSVSPLLVLPPCVPQTDVQARTRNQRVLITATPAFLGAHRITL